VVAINAAITARIARLFLLRVITPGVSGMGIGLQRGARF